MKPAFSSKFGCWPTTPVPYGSTGSKLDISNPNRYGTISFQLAVLLCGRIYASGSPKQSYSFYMSLVMDRSLNSSMIPGFQVSDQLTHMGGVRLLISAWVMRSYCLGFLVFHYSWNLSFPSNDERIWTLTSNGLFTIQSAYKALTPPATSLFWPKKHLVPGRCMRAQAI